MDTLVMIGDCLRDKEQFFLQYEVLTEKMNICDPDDLSNYITARGVLATKIDALDDQIRALADGYGDPPLLLDALQNNGFYDDYPPDLLAVYNQSARIFAIINRIYQQEPRIMDRIRSIQTELLDKIKEGLESAKVYKFFKSTYQEPPTGVFFNKTTR